MINVSNKLKSLRALKGLDQKNIAKILNISVTSYSLKENGKKPFTLQEAKLLADLFNKTIDEIFFAAWVSKMDTQNSFCS